MTEANWIGSGLLVAAVLVLLLVGIRVLRMRPEASMAGPLPRFLDRPLWGDPAAWLLLYAILTLGSWSVGERFSRDIYHAIVSRQRYGSYISEALHRRVLVLGTTFLLGAVLIVMLRKLLRSARYNLLSDGKRRVLFVTGIALTAISLATMLLPLTVTYESAVPGRFPPGTVGCGPPIWFSSIDSDWRVFEMPPGRFGDQIRITQMWRCTDWSRGRIAASLILFFSSMVLLALASTTRSLRPTEPSQGSKVRWTRRLTAVAGPGVLVISSAAFAIYVLGNNPVPPPIERCHASPETVVVSPCGGTSGPRAGAWAKTYVESEFFLRVDFVGGLSPCSVLDHVGVREDEDKVILTVYQGYDPAYEDYARKYQDEPFVFPDCYGIGIGRQTLVKLSSPLGNRRVLDGEGFPRSCAIKEIEDGNVVWLSQGYSEPC